MRHCVGNSPSYARELSAGRKRIWSLRDRHNKPWFTLDVDARYGKPTARSILQLKGKANRTPVFDSTHAQGVTRPDEVAAWTVLFKKLGIDPQHVGDFRAFHEAAAVADQQVAASVSTARLSARLDDIAESLRKRGAPAKLVASIEQYAFDLAV
jgi:hypothetical protein